jgi:hypothetical protein
MPLEDAHQLAGRHIPKLEPLIATPREYEAPIGRNATEFTTTSTLSLSCAVALPHARNADANTARLNLDCVDIREAPAPILSPFDKSKCPYCMRSNTSAGT